MRLIIGLLSLLIIVGSWASMPIKVQADDYLNEQEVDRVRDAQEIDKRTEVFLHIARRRLDALIGVSDSEALSVDKQNDNNKKVKKNKKDKEQEQEKADYGPMPTGTMTQLLQNYTSVINELEDKLDDVYSHQPKDPKLAKAMAKLLSEGQQQLSRLSQLQPHSDSEKTALEKAMEVAKMAVDGARSFQSGQ